MTAHPKTAKVILCAITLVFAGGASPRPAYAERPAPTKRPHAQKPMDAEQAQPRIKTYRLRGDTSEPQKQNAPQKSSIGSWTAFLVAALAAILFWFHRLRGTKPWPASPAHQQRRAFPPATFATRVLAATGTGGVLVCATQALKSHLVLMLERFRQKCERI